MKYDKRCPACGGKAREEVMPDGQGGIEVHRFCKTPDCINYDGKLRNKQPKDYTNIKLEKDAYHDLQAIRAALNPYREKLTLSQAIRRAKSLLICPDCGKACGHSFTGFCKQKVEDRKAKEDVERFLENPGRDHEGQRS